MVCSFVCSLGSPDLLSWLHFGLTTVRTRDSDGPYLMNGVQSCQGRGHPTLVMCVLKPTHSGSGTGFNWTYKHGPIASKDTFEFLVDVQHAS